MKTVHNYRIRIDGEQQVPMPLGALILSVQSQNGALMLWALVDPKEEITAMRTFMVYGTGQPIPEDRRKLHIGTVQQPGWELVWHVFEVVT